MIRTTYEEAVAVLNGRIINLLGDDPNTWEDIKAVQLEQDRHIPNPDCPCKPRITHHVRGRGIALVHNVFPSFDVNEKSHSLYGASSITFGDDLPRHSS